MRVLSKFLWTDDGKLKTTDGKIILFQTNAEFEPAGTAAAERLDHETDYNHALLHTQGTDQGLDAGGANEVSAAEAKTAYDHSQTAHLQFAGLAKISVGAVAPTGPSAGDLWVDTA